ncbi:MAG: DNA repair protein RadA [Candidatus Bipolaricaulaceae bacterium]
MPYRCQSCGYQTPKWLGRCPACGGWDTLQEVPPPAEAADDDPGWIGAKPQALAEVERGPRPRLSTGLTEVDRLLGGGLIPGSVVLFGGEPGVGKSTLLLQIAGRLAGGAGKVLYVSGEEAPPQVRLRAERLGIAGDGLYLLSEQHLLRIVRAVEELRPVALVVDSLQTTMAQADGGEIGGVQQVRRAAAQLARLAKAMDMTCFLVSHITKGGEFAGPKTVEHLVDVAIYLEGTREGDLRLLRSVKNRFGSTHEVAVFHMDERGLVEVANPSTFFVSPDRSPKPGAAIVPVLEGSRTLLVEIQALVAPSGGYGPPQRRMAGLDYNRVLVLLAVVEKRLGAHLGTQDCYLAVAGGLEVREPAVDLGVCVAVLSSLRDRIVQPDTVILGEVGLAGDLRPVRKAPERLREVAKLGFRRAVIPAQSLPKGIKLEVTAARSVEQAAEVLQLV